MCCSMCAANRKLSPTVSIGEPVARYITSTPVTKHAICDRRTRPASDQTSRSCVIT